MLDCEEFIKFLGFDCENDITDDGEVLFGVRMARRMVIPGVHRRFPRLLEVKAYGSTLSN